MAAPDDDEPIPPEEVRIAVANGQLGAWAVRIAHLRHWVALTSLLEHIRGLTIPLGSLADAMRTTLQALQSPQPARRRERSAAGMTDVLRTIRMLVGEALLSRVRRPAMTEADRAALHMAATSFNDAGDWVRAAMTFHDANDFAAAADAWGRLGDLDAMEACLAEDEEQRRTRRIAQGALREIEALVLAGERFAALRLAAAVPQGIEDGEAVRKIVLDLTTRLIRGRGVTLRPVERPGTPERPGERFHSAVRFAGAPAMLGRDGRADVVLRDPGVSRQHARIELVGGELCVVDAGSRAGTYLAGARMDRAFPLRGDLEITLGPTCPIEMHVPGPGRVYLRGVSGLDRGLHAAVAVEAIPLADFWPEAAGTWVEFGEMGARLHHAPETPVRIDGHRASMRVDLLHGETVQIGDDGDAGDARRPQGPFLLEIE